MFWLDALMSIQNSHEFFQQRSYTRSRVIVTIRCSTLSVLLKNYCTLSVAKTTVLFIHCLGDLLQPVCTIARKWEAACCCPPWQHRRHFAGWWRFGSTSSCRASCGTTSRGLRSRGGWWTAGARAAERTCASFCRRPSWRRRPSASAPLRRRCCPRSNRRLRTARRGAPGETGTRRCTWGAAWEWTRVRALRRCCHLLEFRSAWCRLRLRARRARRSRTWTDESCAASASDSCSGSDPAWPLASRLAWRAATAPCAPFRRIRRLPTNSPSGAKSDADAETWSLTRTICASSPQQIFCDILRLPTSPFAWNCPKWDPESNLSKSNKMLSRRAPTTKQQQIWQWLVRKENVSPSCCNSNHKLLNNVPKLVLRFI